MPLQASGLDEAKKTGPALASEANAQQLRRMRLSAHMHMQPSGLVHGGAVLLDALEHIKDSVQALSATQHRRHQFCLVTGEHVGVADNAVVILHPANGRTVDCDVTVRAAALSRRVQCNSCNCRNTTPTSNSCLHWY